MLIRLAGIVPDSIVDGPGIRFTIFVQGCPHNCKGCHNPETHDFSAGKLADVDKIFQRIQSDPIIHGVTFSGGEPFCQPEPLAYLAGLLKKIGYDLMSYSGYTFEELLKLSEENGFIGELLGSLDFLVDGRFVLSKRSLELKFRGSSNQRIIDVPASLRAGKAVLADL